MLKIDIANPGGRDPFVDYDQSGATDPSGNCHPPINYHAFAAATGGRFLAGSCDIEKEEKEKNPIAILLMGRKLARVEKNLQLLKNEYQKVYLAWKECGNFQIANTLNSAQRWVLYQTVLEEADGVIYPSLDPPPLSDGRCIRLPTPYPVDLESWDRSVPIAERSGIFLGTREWFVEGRCHALGLSIALSIAEECDTCVTVINRDGNKGLKLYRAAFGNAIASGRLKLIEGKLPYLDYLDVMARHRIIFQWDRSGVPGQVAGDALLCRSVCLGGNSAIELDAFGHYPDETEAKKRAVSLLIDDQIYRDEIAKSQAVALVELSFSAFRRKAPEIFEIAQGSQK